MTRRRLPFCACALGVLLTVLVAGLPPTLAAGKTAQQRSTTAPVGAAKPGGDAGPTTTASTATPRHQARPVVLRSLAPSTLAPGNDLTVSGTINNATSDTWGDVQVSLIVSEQPITSPDLLEATRSDRSALATRQVLSPGDPFQDLGNIPAGGQAPFTLRIPFERLPITRTPGVYVLGAEVRATRPDGRRKQGDAAVFIPLVPANARSAVRLSVLWPVTAAVPRLSDGYADDRLAKAMLPGGRLDQVLQMGRSAGDQPITWVVDPTVVDAARDMSDGFNLADGTEVPDDDELSSAADTWATNLLATLSTATMLGLPYGDPDATALVHGDQAQALGTAVGAATQVWRDVELDPTPATWPAGGMADRDTVEVLRGLAPAITLLSSGSFRQPPSSASVELGSGPEGEPLTGLVFDEDLGPEGDTVLEWRQQVLAATALTALGDGTGPPGDGAEPSAIVLPPRDLRPDPFWRDADFFGGLRVPWLRLVPSTELATGAATEQPGRLRYPRSARRAQLPAANLDAVGRVRDAAGILISVLAQPDQTDLRVDEAVGLSGSMHWRARRSDLGLRLADSYAADISARIGEIRLETPQFITMSGTEGRLPITVTNGLDEPVEVGIGVSSGTNQLTIEPIGNVAVAAGQRRSISMQVTFDNVGLTDVVVRLRDQQGRAFGTPVSLRVRTTQIGVAIWVIMGIGATLLLVTAARNTWRRIRLRRGSTGPATPGTEP